MSPPALCGYFLIILWAVPSCVAEEAMVDNTMDGADAQDDVYYYGDNTCYVVETDNNDDTDDEYAFYANEIEDKGNYIVNIYKGRLLKTNVLSIINVVLSVLLVFFWVLWLVRTIFPNRTQDL